jgi:hypothetical protein
MIRKLAKYCMASPPSNRFRLLHTGILGKYGYTCKTVLYVQLMPTAYSGTQGKGLFLCAFPFCLGFGKINDSRILMSSGINSLSITTSLPC